MFPILDSCDVREVAVTRYPVRALRLPNALADRQALRERPFPPSWSGGGTASAAPYGLPNALAVLGSKGGQGTTSP